MSKIFYDHIILIEEIFVEVDGLILSAPEKEALKQTIDELVHHRALTLILDLLPEIQQKVFLLRFHQAPYDVVHLKFIEEHSRKDIYHELSKLAKAVKKEVRKEIKKHKKSAKG
mgnify:CR=1 FL=1